MHSPPLRVAHLFQSFQVGGLERMAQRLAHGATPQGVDALAIAYLEDGPIRHELVRAGVPAVHLAGRDGKAWRRPFQIARLLRRHRVDVLHTHHLGPYIYGKVAAKLAGVPVVHTEHSHELYDRPLRRWIGRRMHRDAVVVAVSPEISAWRREAFGRGCRVIPNGVRVPTRPSAAERRAARVKLGVPQDAFVVGKVARLAPEKNHALLLDAVATLPDAWLVLVGDGRERAALDAQARALGIRARVRLLGNRDDVADLLPGLDVLASSSHREGLPLALLEGMAAGLPVVGTAVGGVVDLLSAVGGRLVAPGEAAPFAQALAELRDAPHEAHALGQRGRTLVARRYSEGQMVDRYVQCYHEALEAAA